MCKQVFTAILFLIGILNLESQSINQNVDQWYNQNEHSIISKYFEFLSIPNTYNDKDDLSKNALFIENLLKSAGVATQLLNNKDQTAIPVVYGEVLAPGADKTIIFYAHYDGQPVNPTQWATGLEPFTPVFLTDRVDLGGKKIDFPEIGQRFNPEWRIYGRSSADDKAGVYTIIEAYRYIRNTGIKPNVNIKFFFEGEEERGSINLESILEHHKEKLRSDMWVICDGPMPASGKKQITYGVRGDINVYLTIFGAKRPLHSGNYGNWAPNPAHKMARLLASMKDDEGKVLIDGFYDDVIPLSEEERNALNKIEDPGAMMQGELGFAASETVGKTFLECITSMPTLNINGMSAANTGKLAGNIIPATASAVLDLRLVKGNTVQGQVTRLKKHIEKMGYKIIENEPTDEERKQYSNLIYFAMKDGYPAQRTSMSHPTAKVIADALQKSVYDGELIQMPSSGGSLPLYLFEKVLQTSPVTIPIVNYDNNQHAENENLKLSCLKEGIKSLTSVMMNAK
jgi:acetylornithine deacetylase/succinyl-diaminopimelate desuccinylase-like protein